jgi:N-acetylglucosaminyl-diphospho-decaprenol L-rhamnosyltransferase
VIKGDGPTQIPSHPLGSHSTSFEVCIVSFGSESYIPMWLDSAAKVGASLGVADNHPSGSTLNALGNASDRSGAQVRMVALPQNPGFGAACNALGESSTADWLIFLNPDAVVDSFPGTELVIGTIYGALQNTPDGHTIHCTGQSYRVRDEISRSWGRRMPRPADGVGYVSGGALAISRHDFLRLGGFDERMFLFYEDIDLCLRASAVGCRVTIHPQWHVTHEVGHATRRDWTSALSTSYRSGRYFHGKHHHSVRAYDLYVGVDAAARSLLAAIRRDKSKCSAYITLTKRALTNFVQGNAPDSTEAKMSNQT